MTERQSRFDVIYRDEGVTIDHHFCRQWDEDGGCYGTNPDHGMSWEEAKQHLIDYHQKRIDYYKDLKEKEYFQY